MERGDNFLYTSAVEYLLCRRTAGLARKRLEKRKKRRELAYCYEARRKKFQEKEGEAEFLPSLLVCKCITWANREERTTFSACSYSAHYRNIKYLNKEKEFEKIYLRFTSIQM